MKGNDRRNRRKWSFGAATFDETSWALAVDGCRVQVEAKPLALLHELLLNAGEMVPKEALMESVWPDVFVAEASLTTAMRKLRKAIGDDRRDQRIIETVSGIGYRFNLPVHVEFADDHASVTRIPDRASDQSGSDHARMRLGQWLFTRKAVSASLAVALFLGVSAVATNMPFASQKARKTEPVDRAELLSALRRLDVQKIEEFNKRGWDPTKPISGDKNAALHIALEICEWDPNHDPERLLLLVRTLFDGGARIEQRNSWGDTPYSIAKADRYCGPDHPVTRMMHNECFSGSPPMGDMCLATYEIARRDRAAQAFR